MSESEQKYTLWEAVQVIAHRTVFVIVYPLFIGIVVVLSPLVGMALMWDDLKELTIETWRKPI